MKKDTLEKSDFKNVKNEAFPLNDSACSYFLSQLSKCPTGSDVITVFPVTATVNIPSPVQLANLQVMHHFNRAKLFAVIFYEYVKYVNTVIIFYFWLLDVWMYFSI